ncbi:hypothetical protein DUNSADRAFT_16529 [Dunaliella salina]|uniref:Uncharacterized protein n=1 Tax=Dunaliella salina TaxID=3046 RepID=A0ABQ7G3D0_DUNSA|nr:hypothetical protein DUNSADRAFT_16529 [Dunaliella salina]|eukprot:KAF5829111.1 hypothetical protein DUNSADRAFT_16529 [Dunaliella salina]
MHTQVGCFSWLHAVYDGLADRVPLLSFLCREEQKKATFNESLLVALGVIVFLAVVWLYAVHRLYIDHIDNPLLPDAQSLDMSG